MFVGGTEVRWEVDVISGGVRGCTGVRVTCGGVRGCTEVTDGSTELRPQMVVGGSTQVTVIVGDTELEAVDGGGVGLEVTVLEAVCRC